MQLEEQIYPKNHRVLHSSDPVIWFSTLINWIQNTSKLQIKADQNLFFSCSKIYFFLENLDEINKFKEKRKKEREPRNPNQLLRSKQNSLFFTLNEAIKQKWYRFSNMIRSPQDQLGFQQFIMQIKLTDQNGKQKITRWSIRVGLNSIRLLLIPLLEFRVTSRK